MPLKIISMHVDNTGDQEITPQIQRPSVGRAFAQVGDIVAIDDNTALENVTRRDDPSIG